MYVRQQLMEYGINLDHSKTVLGFQRYKA